MYKNMRFNRPLDKILGQKSKLKKDIKNILKKGTGKRLGA